MDTNEQIRENSIWKDFSVKIKAKNDGKFVSHIVPDDSSR